MRNKPDIEFGNDIPKSFGNSNSIFLSKMEQDVHRHIMNNQNIPHRKKIRLKYIIPIVIMSVPIIFILTILFLYSLPDEPRPQPIRIRASIEDGNNTDSKHGCFFLIRAEKAVDINPNMCTFWVAEDGHSPQKLDFRFRNYSTDALRRPEGGDRNATYRYDGTPKSGRCPNMPPEGDNERWTEGEYIGFDMPPGNMDMNIQDGSNYEVFIVTPEAKWRLGKFVYHKNGET